MTKIQVDAKLPSVVRAEILINLLVLHQSIVRRELIGGSWAFMDISVSRQHPGEGCYLGGNAGVGTIFSPKNLVGGKLFGNQIIIG